MGRYMVIINRTGYLPDTETYVVDSLAEAREALKDEITRTVDTFDDSGEGAEYGAVESESLQAANDMGVAGTSITVGDYVHAAIPAESA